MQSTSPAEDDDNMGDIFRPYREARVEKRRANTVNSTTILKERAVEFTSHNGGIHLVVAKKWDFWPSTGKFMERHGRAGKPLRKGRGVFNLLKLIEEDGRGQPLR
jgi:hypothetical protein